MSDSLSKNTSEIRIKGNVSSKGIAVGPIFLHKEIKVDFNDAHITKESVESEQTIFRESIDKVISALKLNYEKSKSEYGEDIAEVFLGQIAILEDQIFLKEVEDNIASTLTNAEASTFTVFSKKREHFLQLENEYFKDRAFDIHDLKRQIIYKLRGESRNYTLNVPSIVVARDISPSDTIHFKRNHLLGFITEVGGKTSHSAILARSLQIPSISGIKNLKALFSAGKSVVLDGVKGEVILNPSEDTQGEHTIARYLYQKKLNELNKYANKKPVMMCGTKIELLANIEFADDIPELKKYHITDVGLYRSEGYFLKFNELPDEKTQIAEFTKLKNELGKAEVIIRTLDAGGDKIHNHYQDYKEDNPFLGWRAIRLSLDEIGMFRSQIRAILLCSEGTNFKIMLPMISDVSEIIEAKQIIQQLKEDLVKEGHSINEKMEIGAMIETPAAVMIADVLAKEVDFFSIGTNDLTQYTLAVDRGNEKVSYLYQSHHPAVLKSIKRIIDAAAKANIPVSACGEMAGEAISFPLLIGLGLRRFSMAPYRTLTLKQMLGGLSLEDCELLCAEIEDMNSYIDVNQHLDKWFAQKFPDIRV